MSGSAHHMGKNGDKTALEPKKALLTCFETMQLEQAVAMWRNAPVDLEPSDFEAILAPVIKRLQQAEASGQIGDARRLTRQIYAINGFHDFGPDPSKMIQISDLPEGYDGKILLVNLSGGVIEEMVCLRSGDDWHRAILANTKEEILDLGFNSCVVHELGGASVRFEPNGAITLWGASDDFGACDKEFAARLIAATHPGREIIIAD